MLLIVTKSGWGGAQAYVYSLAEQLRDQGALVTVAYGGTGAPGAPGGRLARRLAEAGIETVFLTSFARDIGGFSELRALAELRRTIRAVQPDILHLNSSKAGLLGALAGRIERAPRIIFTAHGWAHREPRPLISRMIIRLLSWMTVFLCHAIIVVSHLDYMDTPAVFSRRKLHEIRNGIRPFPLLGREEARSSLISKTGSRDDRWILMLAELHANKGIGIALSAFAEIREEYQDISLLIMGDGDARSDLQDIAERLGVGACVHFVGFLPEARTYLSSGDLFVLPSLKEGLPMALLEAGIAGLPAIASATGGIPEIIDHDVSGLLVPAGDAAALANAFRSLLDAPARAQALGAQLRRRVMQDFSEDRMVAQTIAVYGF